MTSIDQADDPRPVLVLGGTGKTGRRVAAGLMARGQAVRVATRNTSPAVDWADRDGWAAALAGCRAAYIAYAPDLVAAGAVDDIAAFAALAMDQGVRRLVLLSGRGEPAAAAAERALAASGADWTVIRASWFNQNFTESLMRDAIAAGHLALPVGDMPEPFIDARDIADVAVRALTDVDPDVDSGRQRHIGRIHELTGPRLLSFADATAEIARATGRPIAYTTIPLDVFLAGLAEAGVPAPLQDLMAALFSTLFDGRNARVTDTVLQVTGRPPRDFADFAREAAGAGAFG
ncbi:NmrA family transcriptional regulator [Tistrella bauzanensis]|uniref:NmrA family transcriptional regulator n=1 Tax=Tistrella bauzanensis TaxID=657419 RepID=A0ABQ1IVW8_9PROT|nr:NAD(P)H-binding protein [Tistrella bauzanensis]GGB53177.1 NmrA family transcriptional regulator [Tistrella bauzanensis]